jgi:hypothetical protein
MTAPLVGLNLSTGSGRGLRAGMLRFCPTPKLL